MSQHYQMNGKIKNTSVVTIEERRGIVYVVIVLNKDMQKENIQLSSSIQKRTNKTLRDKESAQNIR